MIDSAFLNRRAFLKFVPVLASLSNASGQNTVTLDPKLEFQNQIKDFLDNLNRELKIIPNPQEITGITRKECDKKKEQFYKFVIELHKTYDSNQVYDFSSPEQKRLEIDRYLLTKGLSVDISELGSQTSSGDNVYIPIFKANKVEELPIGQIKISNNLKIYKLGRSLTENPLEKQAVTPDASTRIFKDGSAAIILSLQKIAQSLNEINQLGINVDNKEYLKHVFMNEIGNYEFSSRYKKLADKQDQVIINIGGKPKQISLIELSEAYSDFNSFSPDTSFPAAIARILGSTITQYEESRIILSTALESYSRKHPGEISEIIGSIELAKKLSNDLELNKKVCNFVKDFYNNVFAIYIFPALDKLQSEIK